MNNKNSILVIGNNQIKKVNTSLDITKKILSQGIVAANNYVDIALIPYRMDKTWYLYNIKSKNFLNGVKCTQGYNHFNGDLTIVDQENPEFINLFYIIQSDDNYTIIDKNGNEFLLGEFKSIRRSEEYTLCLGLNNDFSLFKQKDLVCRLPNISNYNWVPYFEIINDKNILLKTYNYTYGRKYITGGYWTVIGLFNLDGEKIEVEISKEELNDSLKNNGINRINLKDTFWVIKDDGLYFKNTKRYDFIKNEIPASDIQVSSFHFGYAYLRIFIDADPEFGGVYYDDIGYIDVYGNYYWE